MSSQLDMVMLVIESRAFLLSCCRVQQRAIDKQGLRLVTFEPGGKGAPVWQNPNQPLVNSGLRAKLAIADY